MEGGHDKGTQIKLREVQELREQRVEMSVLEWQGKRGNGRLERANIGEKGHGHVMVRGKRGRVCSATAKGWRERGERERKRERHAKVKNKWKDQWRGWGGV